MNLSSGKGPSQKRYPEELKTRAVRMVQELRPEDPSDHSVISRVARQLGVGVESLRSWVKQADVDAGELPGLSSDERQELARLRRENKRLQADVDLLKRATALMWTARLCRLPA